MDRHFLIPATIAAAIHAGLLFGIPSKHAIPKRVANYISLPEPFTVCPEPPPPRDDTSSASPSFRPTAATLPEPPPVNPKTGIEITVPDVGAFKPTSPVTTIPLGPFGPPSDLPPGPGINRGDVLRIVDLDNTPRTRSQTAPSYPFEARHSGLTGQVLVEFTVDESGSVLSPRVASSTDPVFNESALRAVARWKFEPGRRDGRVVRFRMAVPIIFSLNND